MPGEDRGLGAESGPSESRAVPEHSSQPSADDECSDDDGHSARRVRSVAEAVFLVQDAEKFRRGPLAYHNRTRRPGRRTGGGGLPRSLAEAARRAFQTLPDSLVREDLRSWASTGAAKGLRRPQIKRLIRAKEDQLARRARGELPADSSSATSEADTSPDPEEPAESSSPTYSPSSATPSSSDSAVSSGADPPGGLDLGDQ